jgi:hypothetical protein
MAEDPNDRIVMPIPEYVDRLLAAERRVTDAKIAHMSEIEKLDMAANRESTRLALESSERALRLAASGGESGKLQSHWVIGIIVTAVLALAGLAAAILKK